MQTRKQLRDDAKRLFRLCRGDGVLDEIRVRQVVKALTESQRRDRFALMANFHRLVELECVRHAAMVESAVAISPDLLERVQSGLTRTYGRGLRFSYRESPTLIGGICVRVGSDVYDGSVRARLAALETRL